MREHQIMPGLPGGEPLDAQQSEPPIAEVRLSRAIQLNDGRTIGVIRFREPTFRDMLDCGDINKLVTRDYTLGVGMPKNMVVERDPIAVERWFCRLTGLPSSVFTRINAFDGNQIITAIAEVTSDLNVGNSSTPQPIY